MSLEDVKKRFVEEVKLRAYDDKYIDKNEEREILQIAIQQGISVDSARAALNQVCEAQGYVVETRVLSEIKDLIETFASRVNAITAFPMLRRNLGRWSPWPRFLRARAALDEFIYEEIALRLGCSAAAARQQASRGMRMLTERFQAAVE